MIVDGYERFFPPRPCADPQPPYFLTAYEIAVKRGFRGTEEEWLISLTAFSQAQLAGFAGTLDDWLDILADPVPELQIGEVVTLEGGMDATATITGDKRNPILNLGIPRGIGADDALALVGGTMSGNIDMDNHSVTGLPSPKQDGDAVPKAYADKMLPMDGTKSMKADLSMDGHEVTGLPEPTRKDSAVPKEYADKMLPKDGGVMTGDIAMSGKRVTGLGDPVEDGDAVTKKYVDDKKHKFSAVLTANGWAGDAAPYTQTVQIEGITVDDNPDYWPVYSGTNEERIAQKAAFAVLDFLATADGSITVSCFEEKPETDITIGMEVHR